MAATRKQNQEQADCNEKVSSFQTTKSTDHGLKPVNEVKEFPDIDNTGNLIVEKRILSSSVGLRAAESEFTHDLTIIPGAEAGERVKIHGLGQEPHRAVGHQDMSATRMK